ncbi:MAG: hypothetical protein HY423_12550 [Candidatus Lambdaproteobacteria bacterium]|nr:hypothetical protein [Candidatus Lambdaproteobacteria bacterium]
MEALNSSVVLDLLAKFASVFGLVLTIYAVYRIAQIRQIFVAKAELPNLRQNLREHASRINSCLNEFDSQWEFLLEELARCSATLTAVSRVAPKPLRSDAQSVLREIRKLAKSKVDPHEREEKARRAYLLLVELEESIEYRINEMRWEG